MLPVQCLCEFLLHQIETQQTEDGLFENDDPSTSSNVNAVKKCSLIYQIVSFFGRI